MKPFYTLTLLIFSLLALTSPVLAHCEVPCGIYDDQARTNAIAEHITTIEKAMKQITELGSQSPVNYNQIVPKSHATKVLVDVKPLLSILKTANVFARSADSLVNLDIGTDRIDISTTTVDTGDYEASVQATVDGDSLTIALNVQFLMQAVQAANAEAVTLYFNNAAQPVKLESGDYTHIIMPMHIRE